MSGSTRSAVREHVADRGALRVRLIAAVLAVVVTVGLTVWVTQGGDGEESAVTAASPARQDAGATGSAGSDEAEEDSTPVAAPSASPSGASTASTAPTVGATTAGTAMGHGAGSAAGPTGGPAWAIGRGPQPVAVHPARRAAPATHPSAVPTAAPTHPVANPAPERPAARPGRTHPAPVDPHPRPTPPHPTPTPTPTPEPGLQPGSAVVGPQGGTVRLEGSSGGSAAVLRVPAGALDSAVTITMQATTTFGAPGFLSSTVAGVDLQPSGLEFAIPATLDLTVPGGASSQLLAAVLWEDDPAAAEGVPWSTGPGDTVRIDVPHFSGAGVGAPVIAGCASLSLVDPAANPYKLIIGGYAQQLGAGVDPVTIKASLLETLATWRGDVVAPAVAAADSPAEFRGAAQRVLDWMNMVQCLGLGDETNDAKKALTASLRQSGITLAERYLLPVCTALASDIRDWMRIPLSILADFQQLGEEPSARMAAMLGPAPPAGPAHGPYCLRAVVHELEAPDVIDREDRFVEVTLAARLEVVAQGGSLTSNPQRIDLGPFAYDATVTGGTIGGVQQLEGVTDAVGRQSFTIDRGADEDARDPQVTLQVALIRALPGVVPPSLVDEDGPDRAGLTAVTLDLRPEPSLTTVISPNAGGTLPAGATRDVCVTVTDEIGDPVSGAAVAFGFDGPGSPASASATTVDNGVACAAFTSPDDLDEPSSVTVAVVATKGDVTAPTVTLTIPLAKAEPEEPEEPAEPEEPEEPEPSAVPGFAGTLTDDSGSFSTTTPISGGTRVVEVIRNNVAVVSVTSQQVARALAGDPVTVQLTASSLTSSRTTNEFGLAGTSERCTITTVVTNQGTANSATLSAFPDGSVQLRTNAQASQTRVTSIEGPEHPNCFRPPLQRVTTSTGPGAGGHDFFVAPVRDDDGTVIGWRGTDGSTGDLTPT